MGFEGGTWFAKDRLLMPRRWLPFLLLCSTPKLALADSSAADKALAELLFDEAKKLSAEGKHEQACPKFAESHRRDPGIGTMLYLANCYEKAGKLASAWATFREAAQRAGASGQADREKIATQRAAALEANIPRLTVQVAPGAKDAGFEVLVDGTPLAEALWGSAMPVDGGKHVIEAKSPGKQPWKVELEMGVSGGKQSISVPALVPLAVAPAPSASSPAPPAPSAPPAPPATTATPAPPAPPREDRPASGRVGSATFVPALALRFGGALPVGKTGAAGNGTSQSVSSLVSAGPGVEVNGGVRIGDHATAFLFYARQFLGASSDVPGSVTSSYRQSAGLGAQWATSHATQGPVGFFGEVGAVLLDQLALSASSPPGEPVCKSDAKLTGTGVRVGGGANIPVASRFIVAPLITAEIGRFASADVSNDAGCQRKSGGYSLSSKDLHATLFAGVSLSLPLELH